MGGRKEARHGRLSAKLRQQKSLVAHLSLPGLALGFIFCCAGRSLNNTRCCGRRQRWRQQRWNNLNAGFRRANLTDHGPAFSTNVARVTLNALERWLG